MQQTDEALLAAIAQGDMGAFEIFHRRYFPRVMRFAARVADSQDAAEEIGAGDAAWFAWAHVGNDQIILDARREDGSPFTVVGVPTR